MNNWQFYAYLYGIYDQGWLGLNQVDMIISNWRGKNGN